MKQSPDSGLPEATLFIGGTALDPEAVTQELGEAPYKSSHGARPRWFWTTAGRIESPDADDHLRAVLDLAEAFEKHRRAFPNAELRSSLFLPDRTPRPVYSDRLVLRLRRFGPVTLNLSSAEAPTELPPRRDGRAGALAARAGSRSRA